MKFIFRGFSGGMPTLRLTFWEQPGHCCWFWVNFSNAGAGDR